MDPRTSITNTADETETKQKCDRVHVEDNHENDNFKNGKEKTAPMAPELYEQQSDDQSKSIASSPSEFNSRNATDDELRLFAMYLSTTYIRHPSTIAIRAIWRVTPSKHRFKKKISFLIPLSTCNWISKQRYKNE